MGFGDLCVTKAAEIDGVTVSWRVSESDPAADASYGGSGLGVNDQKLCLGGLIGLMEQCMDSDPAKRPTLTSLEVEEKA